MRKDVGFHRSILLHVLKTGDGGWMQGALNLVEQLQTMANLLPICIQLCRTHLVSVQPWFQLGGTLWRRHPGISIGRRSRQQVSRVTRLALSALPIMSTPPTGTSSTSRDAIFGRLQREIRDAQQGSDSEMDFSHIWLSVRNVLDLNPPKGRRLASIEEFRSNIQQLGHDRLHKLIRDIKEDGPWKLLLEDGDICSLPTIALIMTST